MKRFRPRTGDIPSIKLGKIVSFTSTVERDFIFFLEYWKEVVWYQIHPRTIEWSFDGETIHTYTPDFEVHGLSEKTLVECEAEAFVNSDDALQQQRIGQAWCDVNSYSFLLVTDQQLRFGHSLKTIRLLWRYARLKVSPFTANPIKELVAKNNNGIMLNDLLLCLAETPEKKMGFFPQICSMLFHHQLETDIAVKFDESLNWIITPGG